MAQIRILSDALASQVAAGEVVERPASVVKELVENSLDARARRIDVRVDVGGRSLVRVADDGSGMGRDDALLSLERHATSKIRTAEDLGRIASLGFRGEALPSIASVSKFTLRTRLADEDEGTEIEVRGGKLSDVKACGMAAGTVIEVRSLFFNVPARRKFLRTDNTEFGHVDQLVRTVAVAHPGVAFRLERDGRVVLDLPGAADRLERIRALVGRGEAAQLLALEGVEREGLRISGYIGAPGVSRRGRGGQIVFVNGRPVDSPVLSYGLREGYHNALMKGQYPVTFLFIDMDPGAVDVNVHPAKREVRFRDGELVRRTLAEAVAKTLRTERRPGFGGGAEAIGGGATAGGGSTGPGRVVGDGWARGQELLPSAEQRVLRRDWWDAGGGAGRGEIGGGGNGGEVVAAGGEGERVEGSEEGDEEVAAADSPPGSYRIIGVLGKLYVLLEAADGLVLMDQHAAHERVLFDRLRRQLESVGEGEGAPRQALLIPEMIELEPSEAAFVRGHLGAFGRLGVGLEDFGGNSFKLDALPALVDVKDPVALVRGVIEELRGESAGTSRMRLGEETIASTVCRAAVKANDRLRMPELERLLEDLLGTDLPYCCPHGRPTLIQLSYGELEKRFGRQAPAW